MKATRCRKCKNCGNRKRLYKLHIYFFERCKQSYCQLREETTDDESVCDGWVEQKIENGVDVKRLDEGIEDVKRLIKYL